MVGVCVGLVVGLLTGFCVEVVMKQSMIVMMLGGVAGVLLGTSFDVIWFWWRMRRLRADKSPTP